MPEPVITTTGAIGTASASTFSVGLVTLFVGWFGSAGAEVMMLILSAIAGCSIGLSGQNKNYVESILFIVRGILLSVVLAKALSFTIVAWYPSVDSPFLPTVIAFLLGFSVDSIPMYIRGTLAFLVQKVKGGKSNDQ